MKNHILLFLLFIGIHAVHAQPHAFTEEFIRCPDIEYFRVEMRGDSVSFINVYFKDRSTTAEGRSNLSVAYDFRFEGDHYLFRQNHSAAMMELSPNRIDPAKIVNERSRRNSLLCAFIYPDSVPYEYRSSANGFVIHAAYRDYADFKYLGEELQHHAADIAGEKDSILFFQAVIGLDGNIETMELIQGRGGKYTDDIIDFFKSMQGVWKPLNKDGRIYRSLTDICVRLGSDGNIYTSHSLSLRVPKIKIKDYNKMLLMNWYKRWVEALQI